MSVYGCLGLRVLLMQTDRENVCVCVCVCVCVSVLLALPAWQCCIHVLSQAWPAEVRLLFVAILLHSQKGAKCRV